MNFYDTVGGHRFIEGTVPKLVAAVERLADALERANELKEKETVPNGDSSLRVGKYRVVGDHPVMQRPDREFTEEARARVYASLLVDQGYENVMVKLVVNPGGHGE